MSNDDPQRARVPEESTDELYEHAPCGYLSTTIDGRIVRVNQTFSDLIGADREELISGKRFSDLLTIGGRIFYETHFVLMLRMHREVSEVAFDFQGPNERVVPTLVTAVQKRDADGHPVVNRMVVFSATERRRYEQQLLLTQRRAEEVATELARVNTELSKSNAALLKANEDLGQFTYAASHDLQEPLRTMITYAQLLEKGYKNLLDEEARYFIANVVAGSKRMHTLIRDLLAFSRAQGTALVFRAADASEVLAAALANLQSSITETNAVITHDDLPVVTADAALLAQVFQNLIGNAIKYRKPDQVPHIHVAASRTPSGYWTISVQDNGLGFDPMYADQIFGMFKRLHGHEIPGTGIGLAICKKIVELHSGTILVKSVPGAGSQFSFTIPERRML